MPLRKQIKQNARRALGKSWGKAICIFLVTVAIIVIFSMLQGLTSLILNIPDFRDLSATPDFYLDDSLNLSFLSISVAGGFALLGFLIRAPLGLGTLQWYYRLAGAQSEEFSFIFSFFSSLRLFGRSLWLAVNLAVRLFLWAVLFFVIPGGVVFYASFLWNLAPSGLMLLGSILLFLTGILLCVLAAVLFYIFSHRYFLVPYLFAEDLSLSVRRAIRFSIRHTRGFRIELFFFKLSFLPWLLLSFVILPLLYSIPYFQASRALYAKYLIERGLLLEKEDEASRKKEEPAPESSPQPEDGASSEEPTQL